MIGRRRLLHAAPLLAAPPALAQRPGRRPVVAVLMPYAPDDAVVRQRLGAFQGGLERLGWQPGRDLVLEERWTGDSLDQIRAAGEALLRLDPDVIFTTGARVVRTLHQLTRRVPVIFVGVSDPAGLGLVERIGRPGGNITGFSHLEIRDGFSPLVEKQMELLREILPTLAQLGLMFNPENPASSFHRRSFETAAARLGLHATLAPVQDPDGITAAIADFAARHGTRHAAMILPSDLTLLGQRQVIVAGMARHRMPALYADESFVTIGGFASLAADREELFRLAAGYVDRVLRGARPAELPVQMPTAYAFWMNLATARALGLEVPAAVLARAEVVLE